MSVEAAWHTSPFYGLLFDVPAQTMTGCSVMIVNNMQNYEDKLVRSGLSIHSL